MGKPEKYILEVAQAVINCSKAEFCIIGDRLDTDIATGCNLGIDSYLVMTGVTTYDLLEKSEVKPARVFSNLYELMIFDKGQRTLLMIKELSYYNLVPLFLIIP